MYVTTLSLTNIRGFKETTKVEFEKRINILVGPNNSGKSTLLNAIYLLQNKSLTVNDKTIGHREGGIEIWFDEPEEQYFDVAVSTFRQRIYLSKVQINFNSSVQWVLVDARNSSYTDFKLIGQWEPKNFIYPYFSKRKVTNFNEVINAEASLSVTGNHYNLFAKVDRLSNPQFPEHDLYKKACIEIIGFPITAVASSGGKKAALIISNFEEIPLTSMGEGVVSMLGLIVDLCVAKNKLFLIEEPENDIHPKALKALLELIELKSKTNQFIISTHSNIVTKYLGAIEASAVFKVSMKLGDGDSRLPISSVEKVANTPQAKQAVLEDLGYEYFDFDMWKGWLFFEESSAEQFVREFFIPTYTPGLSKLLRTFSARTVGEVDSKFKDFNNLFVFLHLEPSYKNKAWVVVDSGENERQILDKMKQYYLPHGWHESNFLQLSKHNFEEYYPEHFAEQVALAINEANSQKKAKAKSELLRTVLKWAKENPEQAKKEFEKSASEIISILQTIKTSLK